MSEMDAVIRIENLSKWFGDFQVLKNISLNVVRGEKGRDLRAVRFR